MSKEKIEESNEASDVQQGRREFLKNVCVSSVAGLVAASTPAEAVVDATNPDADVTVAEFFQGHFILMSDEEKKRAIERLEKRYSAQYGKKTTVSDVEAPEGVLFGYALDIGKCIGCRRCVYACVKENN